MAALVGALLALSLMAQMASAASIVSTTGSPGLYKFTDTLNHPGMHCYYGNYAVAPYNTDLKKIVIKGPKLFAKNRTQGQDSQTVGWRYIVQHSQAGGAPPWKNYTTSTWVKSSANDTTGHKFGARTWTAPAGKNWQWRVEILMAWYKPGSSTTASGAVTLMDDYAVISFPPNADITNTVPCLPGM
jgi:hypothetical protein